MRSIIHRLMLPARWIGIASLLLVIAACNRHVDVPRESFKTVDITGVCCICNNVAKKFVRGPTAYTYVCK